jgi:hypothetical protein
MVSTETCQMGVVHAFQACRREIHESKQNIVAIGGSSPETAECDFGRADYSIASSSARKLRGNIEDTYLEFRRAGFDSSLYVKLSYYVHPLPSFFGGDLWQSNGPVYVTDAFHLCFEMQIETFAACFLLTKIAKLIYESQAQNILFKDHSGAWLGVAFSTS